MNTSLRDQLLKAGLVTEKQARQAEQQEQQRRFRKDRGPQPGALHGNPRQPGQSSQRQPAGDRQPEGRTRHESGVDATDPAGRASAKSASPPLQQHRAPAPATRPNPLQQAQAAKLARDRELNRRRDEKAARRARLAQIEQIVEQHRVPRLETEDYYSFLDGRKVRRMSVDNQRREQLTAGLLIIVRYKGHYAVVPSAAAERIRERDPNMIVPHLEAAAKSTSGTPTDDEYKDYVVPDDLMW